MPHQSMQSPPPSNNCHNSTSTPNWKVCILCRKVEMDLNTNDENPCPSKRFQEEGAEAPASGWSLARAWLEPLAGAAGPFYIFSSSSGQLRPAPVTLGILIERFKINKHLLDFSFISVILTMFSTVTISYIRILLT